MTEERKGKLIVFEGPEGTGKTVQSAMLHDRLYAEGRAVVRSKEPGQVFNGTLRNLLLSTDPKPAPIAELLLFLADRAQHVATIVKPALEAGKIVILDRFTNSTLAYQWMGKHESYNPIKQAFCDDYLAFVKLLEVAADYLVPDAIVYLDVPPEQAAYRLHTRSEARRLAQQEDQAFKDNIHRYFHETMPQQYRKQFRRVDGVGTPDEVFQRVFAAVLDELRVPQVN